MPLPVFSQLYDRIDIYSSTFKYFVGAVVVLLALRVWSSTPSLRVRRVLHGRTVVISVGPVKDSPGRKCILTAMLRVV